MSVLAASGCKGPSEPMHQPSRFAQDIIAAVAVGRLDPEFKAADVMRACPDYHEYTYSSCLARHAIENPYGNHEYFERVARGVYRLAPGMMAS